jgi:hypothetical protein
MISAKMLLNLCDKLDVLRNAESGKYHNEITTLLMVLPCRAQNKYMPTHFTWEELVPPGVFSKFGIECRRLFDNRILWSIDQIREYFDRPVVVNNWKVGCKPGGTVFTQRGFRTADLGAKYSLHARGSAIDFDVKDIPAETVRQEILAHQSHPAFQYITRMEANVNWVHIDNAMTDSDDIVLFNPS